CAGTEGSIEGLADNCVATLSGDVPGNGKCPSASAKAVGKGASCELGCAAKDVTKPGSFRACPTKRDGKVTSALSKAGSCGQSGTIQADVDSCETSLANALTPTSTTSTTTSTSTTSTSTSSSTSSSTSTSTTSTSTSSTTPGSPSPAFL